MLSRRGFLTGLIAAPFVVRSGVLMPLRGVLLPAHTGPGGIVADAMGWWSAGRTAAGYAGARYELSADGRYITKLYDQSGHGNHLVGEICRHFVPEVAAIWPRALTEPEIKNLARRPLGFRDGE